MWDPDTTNSAGNALESIGRWVFKAACVESGRDLDAYFVEAGRSISASDLAVCHSCPVRIDCLKHSYLTGSSAGYFGGLSPGQRRTMTVEEAVAFVEAESDDSD